VVVAGGDVVLDVALGVVVAAGGGAVLDVVVVAVGVLELELEPESGPGALLVDPSSPHLMFE
jgi:hypothetical protein